MYDHRGDEVDPDLDAKVEKEFNALLDRISKEDAARSARIHGEADNERRSTTKSNGSTLGSGAGSRIQRTASKTRTFVVGRGIGIVFERESGQNERGRTQFMALAL